MINYPHLSYSAEEVGWRTKMEIKQQDYAVWITYGADC